MEHEKMTELKCLFCTSIQFELPSEDYEPKSGDMLKCANCGRLNDYDSMMRVVEKEAEEWGENIAQDMVKDLEKQLKKVFK
jgi:hypothetical protein